MKVTNRHDIHINAGDVQIMPLDKPLCGSCGEKYATQAVWLDLRGVGQSVMVEKLCRACAREFAAQLKKSI